MPQDAYEFVGFLSPIPKTESRTSSTIPVKFKLPDYNNKMISNAKPTIYVKFNVTSNGITRTYQLSGKPGPMSGQQPNTGNLFRYDKSSQQYVYNLATTGYSPSLTKGTLTILVDLGDGSGYKQVQVSLK